MHFRDKIVAWEDLPNWRKALRTQGRRLVVTNGAFDLLHVGHVTYLEQARDLGDALLVGLNSDASIQQLKGPTRPVNPESDRAAILASLESVSAVCIFQEKRATRFLELVQPDVYVKGGDYTLETLDQDERRAVEQNGGRIVLLSFVAGKSTSETLKRISDRSSL